ncbi:hypothetical protein F9222_24700 [Escherichia coli]|nr:hypothetical protein F9222_24700 [Escherichia coli]
MAIPTATTKAECLVGLLTGKTVAQASFLAGKAVVLPLSCGLTPSGHIAGGRAMHFYRMLTLIMSNFCKLITKKCVIMLSINIGSENLLEW